MLKVILRENVENMGRVGDVVKVSDGYARNYLIPRKLCVIADEGNAASMQHFQREGERKKAKSLKKAQEFAVQLENYSCTLKRKVGEQDKLFGSVTAADIAAALKEGGYAVDKRSIEISDHIRTVGVYTVQVKVHPEVHAKLKVWVVGE